MTMNVVNVLKHVAQGLHDSANECSNHPTKARINKLAIQMDQAVEELGEMLLLGRLYEQALRAWTNHPSEVNSARASAARRNFLTSLALVGGTKPLAERQT
jgi:hypothetical protein